MWDRVKACYTRAKDFVCGKVEVVVTSVVAVAAVVVTVVNNVFAGVDFTDVTISTADIFTFAGIILAAIGAIWGIKKLIGMGNKS